MVDLRPDQLATVKAILIAEVPEYEIWAFGSRAQWTAKDSSDLDLALVSDSPVSFLRISHLKQAFEESYLPFKVDIIDLSKISADFREVIEEQHVVLRRPEENGSKRDNQSDRRAVLLEDVVETIIDYRGKIPKKVDSGIPLITAKLIKNGHIGTPTEFISREDYDDWMRRGLPKEGDVLLTTNGPLGQAAQLHTSNVALARGVVALRGRKNLLDDTFFEYLLQSPQVQDQLKARASGATVPRITQSELRKINLTLPPIAEQRAIAHVLSTLDRKIELNQRMNDTLQKLAQLLFRAWFEEHAESSSRDKVAPLLRRIQLNLEESATLADLRDVALSKLLSGKTILPLSGVQEHRV